MHAPVEIIIKSSVDPSRIAGLVVHELQHISEWRLRVPLRFRLELDARRRRLEPFV